MEVADGWAERSTEVAQSMLGGAGWSPTKLHGTGGAQYGSSVVRLRRADESVVVKIVRRNDAKPDDPDYWRREFELYGSTHFSSLLPEGVAVPRCIDATETEEAAVMLLEDVPFDDRDERQLDWYGRLANGLARLTARADELPTWSSRGFVGGESARFLSGLPSLTTAPLRGIADLAAPWPRLLERLAKATPAGLHQLDVAPQGFNHLDAFSRNAAQVQDRMVIIDWAYAGLAPVGTDAAAIVTISAMHGDVDAGALPDLYRLVVDEYLAGLAADGFVHDPVEIRASIDLLAVMRFAGFLVQLNSLGDRLVEVVEAVGGRPFTVAIGRVQSLSEFIEPIAVSVLDRIEHPS